MGNAQTLRITWTNKDKALIPTEKGKYGYTWVDPSDPRYCETHYLDYVDTVAGIQAEKEEGRTYSERADLEPQSDNLLILGESGDVLEALTRVPELREKYVGKVKCVYIDPPFNTAQTFANYEDNLEHSIWLTMMRDRLEHLWKLLSDDGSIWVHLDDVENHRMRMLLDEVFGSANFVADFIWQKRTTRENRSTVSVQTDSIVVYCKSAYWKETRNLLPRVGAAGYSNPDNDPRGPWTSVPFTAQFNPAENERWSQRYTLELPSGEKVEAPAGSVWRFTEARYNELRADGRLWFGADGNARPRLKKFLTEVAGGLVPFNFLPAREVGSNDTAKREIQALFPDTAAFATPKPERLLERIIHIATNPGDIVLDVFAGSGTTAAVAQKMGRRWVTCELVEDTFDRFTRPRLEMVVRGEDMGGISVSKGERVDATEDGLPEGLSAEDAQKLVSLLNKATKDQPELKKSAAIKAVKELVKTSKAPDTINWRGGGGFTVARLSPACFDYLPELGLTVLTEDATGEVLEKSVAANLGFPLTDEPGFVGKRNREYLAVVEGVLTTEKADDFMAQLPDKHSVVLAATELPEGIEAHVRSYKNGSSVVHIPSSLFATVTPQES